MLIETIEKFSEIPIPPAIYADSFEYQIIEGIEFDDWKYYGLFNVESEYTGVGRRVSLLDNAIQEGQFTRGKILGMIRMFNTSGKCEVGSYRMNEAKHLVWTRFNIAG